MKILFAGSPAIAVPALEALAVGRRDGCPWELRAVLTNPDTVKGRGGAPSPTPVAVAASALSAEEHPSLVILKPDAPSPALIAGLNPPPDILISFAYGHIFRPEFLALFPAGALNIHPSLLPKYRGASPIQQAILDGAAETGVTIQRLAAKLDAGAILAQQAFPLTGSETTASLSETVAHKAAALLSSVLVRMAKGALTETPQNDAEASYCSQFTKNDGLIDWSRAARAIDAQIRAFTPWPLSWTFAAGRRLTILSGSWYDTIPEAASNAPAGTVLGADAARGLLIQTGAGIYAAERLQWAGRPPLGWKEFLNGARGLEGATLGSPAA